MADVEEEFHDNEHVLIFTNLDDVNQPYSCNQWGSRHEQYGAPDPIITNDSGYTMMNMFGTFSANGAYIYFPSTAILDHNMTLMYKSTGLSSASFGSYKINELLSDCGDLCSQEPVLGCTDSEACNYNNNADIEDNSCDYETCTGCTDTLADNYDNDATIDNNSCIYGANISFGQVTASSIDILLSNSSDIQGFQFSLIDSPDEISITGANGGRAEEYNFEVSSSDLGIVIGFSFSGAVIPAGDGLLTTLTYTGNGPTDICINDVTLSDSNANSLGVGIDDCFLLDIVANPGDTNLDGFVNVQDIVILINFILGFSYPDDQEFINSDMNEDGIINVLDVIIIVNSILGVVQFLEGDINNYCDVNFNQLGNNLILSISSEINFSGVQLMISSEQDLNVTLKDNSHITTKDNFVSNQKRFIAYSMFNNPFDGHQAEFTIENGSGLNMDNIQVVVSDRDGNELKSVYKNNNINFDTDYVFNINNIYPNPFNPTTDIEFSVKNDGYIKLVVYNINGQKVDSIFEGFQKAGSHSYTWDASLFTSGMYYFHLVSNDEISYSKAMLIK